MATDLSSQLKNLDASQLATITFLSGIDSTGAYSSASYANYVAATYNAANPTKPKDIAGTSVFGGQIGVATTVTYSFEAGSAPFAWTTAEENEATQALALWSGMAGISFQYVPTGGEVEFVHSGDAAYVAKTSSGTSWNPTNVTYTKVGGVDQTNAGYVQIDPSFGSLTDYQDSLDGYGIGSLVHEAGHLLGLGHAGPYNQVGTAPIDWATYQRSDTDVRQWSTMSYVDPANTGDNFYGKSNILPTDKTVASYASPRAPYTPMGLDIFAAQRLYGGPATSTFSGNNTFGFNSNIMYTQIDGTKAKLTMYDFDSTPGHTFDEIPIITIYDTGTKNTLDLSGYTTSSSVDLRDGEFSSVAGLHDNIFIEYGTQIDHVIGGSGDDSFVLNARSDVVDGGGGTNTAVLSGHRSDYVLTFNGGTTILTQKTGAAATYQLSNIQNYTFAADNTTVTLAALARVEYVGPAYGHFGIAANWSNGTVPNTSEDVDIGQNPVIVTQQDLNEVDSLTVGVYGSLDIQTGHFVVENAGAGSVNAGIITIEAGATMFQAGGIDNTGEIDIDGTGNQATLQTYGPVVILTGGGKVNMTGASAVIGGRTPNGTDPFDAFYNVDNYINGSGTIGLAGFTSPVVFINGENGFVAATSGTLTIAATTFNNGYLVAAGGTLDLRGSVDQTGGGTIVAGSGSTDLLDGTTIFGGTLNATLGGIEVSSDSTLNAVALSGTVTVDAGVKLTLIGAITGTNATIDASAGSIDLTQAQLTGVALKLPSNLSTNGLTLNGGGFSGPVSGAGLTLLGTITNTSTILLEGYSYYGQVAQLTVGGTLVLTGGGTINMFDGYVPMSGGEGTGLGQIITGAAGAVLDNRSGFITGFGQIGTGTIGIINEAGSQITATGSTLVISPGAAGLINNGTIEAYGGTLELHGTITEASTGSILADNSTVNLVGASITGGYVGTGGTVNGAVHVVGTAALSGLTTEGDIDVDAGTTLTLGGTIANYGNIKLNAYSYYGQISTVTLSGAVTLTKGGHVTLVDNYSNAQVAQIVGTTADSLDNVDNTISGYGNIGGSAAGFANEAGGTVIATGGTLTLNSGPSVLANLGLMQASNGTLELSGNLRNAGSLVAAAGGTVLMHAIIAYGGSVSAMSGGTIAFDGGTEIGSGSFTVAAGGTLQVISTGTLDGSGQSVILNGNTAFNHGSTLYLKGIIQNGGYINLRGYSYYGQISSIDVEGLTKLTGYGTITMADDYSNSSGSQIISGTSADTLDNVTDLITGYGQIGNGTIALINEFVIQANGGTLVLNTGNNGITNTDLMTAVSGATLEIDSITTNTGEIDGGVGGIVHLRANISGAGKLTAIDTGTVTLDGSAIAAAETVSSTAQGAITILSTGSLDGTLHALQLAGTTTVTQGATLALTGAVTNSGTLVVQGYSYYGQEAIVTITGTATLSGGGQVVLTNAYDNNIANAVTGTAATASLVNVNNTISGYGLLGTGIIGLVNQAAGTIRATGNGTLVVSPGTLGLTNAGLLDASTGTLELHGSIANAGGRISATGGVVTLAGTSITGGTLSSSGMGAIKVVANDALTSVVNAAALTVQAGTTLSLAGTIQNSGSITLTGYAYYGAYASIAVSGTTVLTGGGTIVMTDQSGGAAQSIFGSVTGSDTLDNQDNTIVGAGLLGQGTLGLINRSGGTIDATGGTLTVAAGPLGTINNGLLEATTGTLDLQGVISGFGRVSAAGGTVQLDGVNLSGNSITGSGPVVVVGSATLVALATSASIAVNAATTLTLEGPIQNSGVITVTGNPYYGLAATIVAEGGVSLSGGGTLNLAAGSTIVSTGIAGEADSITNIDNTITGTGTVSTTLFNGAAGKIIATGDMTFAGTLGNAGEIRLGGSTLTAGAIVSSGLIDGTGTIMGSIAGAGVIEAKGGTLTLVNAVSGTLQIDAGSTMVLQGGAAAGTGVTFTGTGGLLDIDVPAAGAQPFTGTVSGNAIGNAIDLVGIAATGSFANGVLTLSVGGQQVGAVNYGSSLVATAVSDGNGGTLLQAAAAPTIAKPDDLNGDGKSDIILQNTGGTTVAFTMNGGNILAGTDLGSFGPGTQIVGSGDFNGDGTADVIVQGPNTSLIVFTVQNTSYVAGAYLGSFGPTWSVSGTGDFNGDGKSDILLSNTNGSVIAFTMSGGQIVNGTSFGNLGTTKVVGVGDFDGDGTSDELVQTADGTIVEFGVKNDSFVSGTVVGNFAGFRVAGVGDFDHDGKSDILVQNTTTGDAVIFNMAGGNVVRGAYLGSLGGSAVVATGDYNGDGTSDVLTQSTTGALVEFTVDNDGVSGGYYLGNPGTTWHAVTPELPGGVISTATISLAETPRSFLAATPSPAAPDPAPTPATADLAQAAASPPSPAAAAPASTFDPTPTAPASGAAVGLTPDQPAYIPLPSNPATVTF